MSNENTEQVELDGGKWRSKAYNLHGPTMNPYRGYFPEQGEEPVEDPNSEEIKAAILEFLENLKASAVKPQGEVEPSQIPDLPTETTGELEWPEDVVLIERSTAYASGEKMAQGIHLGLKEEQFANHEVEEIPWQYEVQSVLSEAASLFLRKNKEYGNAFVSTGALGSAVALTGDVARLRVMLIHTGGLVTERELANVRDKFIDVLVQAAMGVMMIDAKNIVGR